jgi:hypothetical protein
MSPRLSRGPQENTRAVGVRCPKCQCSRYRVLQKRRRTYGWWRQLQCSLCRLKFSTEERLRVA